ncbi:hypothetical protein PoB_002767500 [Plakobranchus ocellatus]|uniref:Uncharacterized protein n=1 Tax=Plakobranchus ocellatus TaxID=259542 RepID=A0AAV4A2L7_9GAST|nr:hypothetical protein PoB_002767500 [Plakobranchus ocellatus]
MRTNVAAVMVVEMWQLQQYQHQSNYSGNRNNTNNKSKTSSNMSKSNNIVQERQQQKYQEHSLVLYPCVIARHVPRGVVGGTVASESAMRSAVTLLSRLRHRPDGGAESLKSPSCRLLISEKRRGWVGLKLGGDDCHELLWEISVSLSVRQV